MHSCAFSPRSVSARMMSQTRLRLRSDPGRLRSKWLLCSPLFANFVELCSWVRTSLMPSVVKFPISTASLTIQRFWCTVACASWPRLRFGWSWLHTSKCQFPRRTRALGAWLVWPLLLEAKSVSFGPRKVLNFRTLREWPQSSSRGSCRQSSLAALRLRYSWSSERSSWEVPTLTTLRDTCFR